MMQRAGWLALIATPLSLALVVVACASGDEKVAPAPNTLCAAAASWAAKCGTPANACDANILNACTALQSVMSTTALAAATSCLQNASTCSATPTECLAGSTSGLTPTKEQSAVESDYCTTCQPSGEAACQQAFFTPASSVAQVSSSLLALDDTVATDVDKCVVSGCGSTFPMCAQTSILNSLSNALDGNNAAVSCIVAAISTPSTSDGGTGADMDAAIGFGDDDTSTDGSTGSDGSIITGTGGDGGMCPVISSSTDGGDGGSCVDDYEPDNSAAMPATLASIDDGADPNTISASISLSGPTANCGDEDWYKFDAVDVFNTAKDDPYASVTALTNVEVCIWASRNGGTAINSGCISGNPTDYPVVTTDDDSGGSAYVGCCSSTGTAQLDDYSRDGSNDDSTVMIRVRMPTAGQMCVPYTLAYAFTF